MSRSETLWQSFRQLPRAAQWGIGAVVGGVLLLLWNDYVLRLADEWNRESERLLAKVDKAAGSGRRLQSLRRLRPAVLGIGPVTAPGREAYAERALNDVVNDVLKQHVVSRDSFSNRGSSRLRRGTLSRVLAPGEQVEHITGDLRFDSTPTVATAIIAELESSPWVDAISYLRMTRQPGPRKVTVDMTIEAWIVSTERRARVGGT